jgi:hypothetical protein
MFIKFCHTASEILEFANSQIKQVNNKTVLTEITDHSPYGTHIEFKTNRGAKVVAVVFNRSPGQLSFRSILKIKNKQGRATWLHNGQGSTNTEQLVFNGENGKTLRAPIERFKKAVYDSISHPGWTEEEKVTHTEKALDDEIQSRNNVDGFCILKNTSHI